jgi:hypothetical protein
MIHYHGLPITPASASSSVLSGRHAFLSYANPDQLDICIEVCQSFAVDNGAFPAFTSGKPVKDWKPYYEWVDSIKNYPNFDFAVIPDEIDGDEIDNDNLIAEWEFDKSMSAPVWHMHESIERFYTLCNNWSRVCIGSSGAYWKIGNDQWWARIGTALNEIVDDNGQPPCKLHGLRMLNPEIFSRLPLASADSTNLARNIGIDKKWTGSYSPPDKEWRAKVIASRIEAHNSASAWSEMVQDQLF